MSERSYRAPRRKQQFTAAEIERQARVLEQQARQHTSTTQSGGIGLRQSGAGLTIDNQHYEPFWARITDVSAANAGPGAAIYGWQEVYEVNPDVTPGGWEDNDSDGRSGSTTLSPAYEINNNLRVPINAWVQMWLNETEEQYEFYYQEGPVPAVITTSGAPTTTITGSLGAADTSITVAAASSFPGRNKFRIQIDDEVMEVTAGAATTSWTVTRAVDSTSAVPHTNGSTITLVGAYAWTEQEPIVGGNDTWQNFSTSTARTGTQTAEPARDRNHNTQVPDGTFVLLWRKTRDGSATSTISAGVTYSTTTIPISSRTNFPQVMPFYIRIDQEYMKVTAGAGSGAGNFTVVRGRYGSVAVKHDSTAAVVEAICEWVFDYCCETRMGTVSTRNLTVYDSIIIPDYSYGSNTTRPALVQGMIWVEDCTFTWYCGGQVKRAASEEKLADKTQNLGEWMGYMIRWIIEQGGEDAFSSQVAEMAYDSPGSFADVPPESDP